MSDSEQDETSEVNSNILTSDSRASHGVPILPMTENEAKSMFFDLIGQWFSKFMRNNSMVQQLHLLSYNLLYDLWYLLLCLHLL